MKKPRIRVRFAPSPTGSMHIGGLRTALYNYLFAKKNGGDFLLRIEDTDQSRKVQGAYEEIVQVLHAYGLEPDEGPMLQEDGTIEEYGSSGPYIQSQRLPLYRKAVDKLLEAGFAYRSFATEEELDRMREIQKNKGLPPRYNGADRDSSPAESKRRADKGEPFVIRLKMPTTGICTFHDIVRGKVSFSYATIDDQVLLKSDGFPTYHLANVVDDHEMGITHVIRGEEWLPSTPKHIFLYEAFGWTAPMMAHLPVLLDVNGGKLSKRSGAKSAKELLAQGYLPEAILNFLLLLGWNPKTEQEIFGKEEMIELFSLEDVHSAGAVVNEKKLLWMNKEFLKKMSPKEFEVQLQENGLIRDQWKKLLPQEHWYDFLSYIKERINLVIEATEHLQYFFENPVYEKDLLLQAGKKELQVRGLLQESLAIFLRYADKGPDFIKEGIERYISEKKLKRGDMLWPIRVALSGKKFSPGAYELLSCFSKDVVKKRLEEAIACLGKS